MPDAGLLRVLYTHLAVQLIIRRENIVREGDLASLVVVGGLDSKDRHGEGRRREEWKEGPTYTRSI